MASLTEPQNKIRVFMIPYFATGHMIPMTDLALLLAENPNVEPTIVTTPANADILRPSLSTDGATNPVRILTYPFPQVGLPAGVENLATAPIDESWRIDQTARQLSQHAHESLLRANKPDAIISDINFWWTTKIANDLSIPRLTFCPIGLFSFVAMHNLFKAIPDVLSRKDVDPYHSYITVPDLPGQQISLPVSELPCYLRGIVSISDIAENIVSSRLNGSGTVLNTFNDLEKDYCETFMKIIDPNLYLVGPLGLNTSNEKIQATKRGGHGNEDCLSWLDKMPSQSVVYLCFGSWCHFSVEQLHELAMGLDESGKNFLWVVRNGKDATEEWMPEGWEERVKSRGLVIKGWAPQSVILKHESIGAFMTHCGGNSILEAVSAGVPMLTWPLAFEQFINEKFVVEVKGYGARVWEGGKRSTIEHEKQVVPREVISQAVSQFLEPGGVGETARAKVKKMAKMSKDAIAEDGSSQKDLHRLFDVLFNAKKN